MAKSRFFAEHKITIGVFVAVIIAILALIVAMYRLPSALNTSQGSQANPKAATSTTVKPAPGGDAAPNAADEGPYKGWKTYTNKAWRVFLMYPPDWTMTETDSDSLHVTFLGPALPAGSPIQNECVFSVFVENVPPGAILEDYVAAALTTPLGGGSITTQLDTTLDSNLAIEMVDTYVDVGQPWKRSRHWTLTNGKAYTFTYAADLNYKAVDYYVKHEMEAYQITESIAIR